MFFHQNLQNFINILFLKKFCILKQSLFAVAFPFKGSILWSALCKETFQKSWNTPTFLLSCLFFFHHTLKGSISCLKLFTAHLCFNPYTLLFKKLLIIFLLFILLVAFSVVYPLRRLYHCRWYPSWQFSLLASGTTVFS